MRGQPDFIDCYTDELMTSWLARFGDAILKCVSSTSLTLLWYYEMFSNLLQTLLKYPEVDLGIRGETGMRPLHYCSMKDNADCARILVRNIAFYLFLLMV